MIKNMNKKGFTLIEILIVVAIVAILVLLAIPAVQRSVYHSRNKSFVKDARTVASAAKRDSLSIETNQSGVDDYGDIVVYKINQINGILDKKLNKSPFGSKYKAASVMIRKMIGSQGEVKYVSYVCMIDNDGNGFDFTPVNEISSKIISHNLKDVTCDGDFNVYDVVVNVVGGSTTFPHQKVMDNEEAEFELSVDSGYETNNPTVTCDNGQNASINADDLKLKTSPITHSTTCTVTFKKKANYTVSLVAVNGNISGNSVKKVLGNATTTFSVQANEEYEYNHISCTNDQTARYNGNIVTTGAITSDTTCTITFNPNVYHINYDLNGGRLRSSNPTSYTVETDTFALKNPEKTGYTFSGWTGTGLDGPTTPVTIVKGSTGDRSYTAVWHPIVYSINYDLAGGSVSSSNPTSYTIETDTFTLKNPSKDSYSFTGWTGTGLSKATTSVTIPKGSTGNRNYTATYRSDNLNVTYYSGNLVVGLNEKPSTVAGGNLINYSVNSSGTVTVKSLVSYNGNNDSYGFIDGVSVYLEAGKTYVFSMSSTGTWGPGSAVDTVEAFLMNSEDNSIWHRLAEKSGSTTTPAGSNSITFTAQRTGTYLLRLDVNKLGKTYSFSDIEVYQKVGTSVKTHKKAYGDPPDVSRTGYSLSGWYTDKINGSVVKSNTTVTNPVDHSLYTHWTPKPVVVTYYSGNLLEGFAAKAETEATSHRMRYSIDDNNVVTVTALENDGYGYIDGVTVNLVQGKTYVFSCDTDGVWGSDLNDTVTAYFMYSENNDINYKMSSNKNYEFVPSQTGKYWLRLDVNKAGMAHEFSNIDIYEKVESRNKLYGQSYGTAPNVSRTDYNLSGWYTEKSEGSIINPTTTVNNENNHSLYTHWKRSVVDLTCPTSPADKEYIGSELSSGIVCPTGSTAGGTTKATNRGTYTQTCTANTGYRFASACNVNWKIKCNTTITGDKTKGSTVTYAGRSWTVVDVSSGNISLAYNGVSGSGAYNGATAAVKDFLDEKDISKDALAAQCIINNGSSSGITDNLTVEDKPDVPKYWMNSTNFYNNETLSTYVLDPPSDDDEEIGHYYSSGYRAVKGSIDPVTHLIHDNWEESDNPYYAGEYSLSEPFSVESDGTLKLKDGAVSEAKKYGNGIRRHSRYFSDVRLHGTADSSTALAFTYRANEHLGHGEYNTIVKYEGESQTKRINIWVCGGDSDSDDSQGNQIVARAKSTTQFHYGNREEGYGFNSSSDTDFDISKNALSYDYSENWYIRTAAYVTGVNCPGGANCTVIEDSNPTRYVRNIRASTSLNCEVPEYYSLLSRDLGKLSYRPYITVKTS